MNELLEKILSDENFRENTQEVPVAIVENELFSPWA